MALISATEARQYIPSLSDGDSTYLDTLISRADHVLAQVCGYPEYTAGTRSLEDQSYTLYLDGPGGRDLYLPRPIQSITSIHADPDGAYGATTEVDSGDWTLYSAEGLVRLDVDGTQGVWPTARRSVKVVATLGYTTAPEGLKHATALLVAHWYRNTVPSLGKTSITERERTVGLVTSSVPREIKEAVRSFVWWRGVL